MNCYLTENISLAVLNVIPSNGTLDTSSRTRPLQISLELNRESSFILNCLPLECLDVRHVLPCRLFEDIAVRMKTTFKH
jgi:hypothetical protein